MGFRAISPDEFARITRPHKPHEPARHVAELSELAGSSVTRNERATSVVVRPPRSRSARATCAPAESAGWQQGDQRTLPHSSRPTGRRSSPCDQLLAVAPTPVVALNRAVAIGEVRGPAAALALVDELHLDNYQPFHATRADLLRRLGRNSEAAGAYKRAAAMAPTTAERDFLRLGRRASR
jgi:hypothetical protein